MSKKSLLGSIVLISLVLGLITLAIDFLRYKDSSDSDVIGVVNIKKGQIKVKNLPTGTWVQLHTGDPIREDSVVLSGSGSSAKYVLTNGVVIDHHASSMLTVELDTNGKTSSAKDVEINVVDGSFLFVGEQTSGKSTINIKNNKFKMGKKDSSIKVDNTAKDMSLYVIKGSVDLESNGARDTILAGEYVTSSPNNDYKQLKKAKTPEDIQHKLESDADAATTELSILEILKERSIQYIYNRLIKPLSF